MEIQQIFLMNDELTEKKIDSYIPNGIDWQSIFLFPLQNTQLNERFQKLILNMKISYKYFLIGLQIEYIEKDLQKALQTYKQGCQEKDSYCFFKLYYIHRYQFLEFNFEKNKDEEIFLLLQSCVYYDHSVDFRYKITPMMQLLNHAANEDQQFEKLLILANNYQDKFFYFWIQAKFNIGICRKDSMLPLEIIAQNNSEASYFLADIAKEHVQSLKLDLKYSEKFYLQALQKGCLKSYFQLGNYFNQINKLDLSLNYFQQASEVGCFRGFYDCACIIFIQNKKEQYQDGLEKLISSFLLGYMFSVDDLEFVLSKMKIKVDDQKIYQELVFIMASIFLQNYKYFNKNTSTFGSQYYILSHIHSKGIHVPQDITKAKEILLKAEEDINVEKKRYIVYRMGRLFPNQNYKKDAFDSYEQISYDDKYMSKFPSLCYKFGIMFEQGFGVDQNLILAQDYYERGTYRQNKNALIQNYFYNKSVKAFNRLKNNNIKYDSRCLIKFHQNNKEIKQMNLVGKYLTVHDKHELTIFDVEKLILIFKVDDYQYQNQIVDVKIHQQNQILMILLRINKKILIYDLKTFKLLNIFPINKQYIKQLVILDNKRVIIFDNQMIISIYDYMKRLPLEENLINIDNNFVANYGCYDYDEENMTLFIPDRQQGVNFINFSSDIVKLEKHSIDIEISCMKLSKLNNQKYLFISTNKQEIMILDIIKFSIISKFGLQQGNGINSFCIFKQNIYVASQQTIFILVLNDNLEVKEQELTLNGHTKDITSINFYEETNKIISIGKDHRVRLWSIK